MPDHQPNGSWMPVATELAMASGAAFLAGYVRAKADPRPLSLASMTARCAEAVVCGCIAIGVSAWLEAVDPRATVGLSAALGLIGTGVISDLVMRWMAARAGKGQ